MTEPNRAASASPTRACWQRPVVSKLASRDARNTPLPGGADGAGTFGS